VDDDFIPVGVSFYQIFGFLAKFLLNVNHDHFKPTLGEALPRLGLQAFATPLQLSVGDLLSGDGFGFVSLKDLDVIGLFVKDLFVNLLL
jgi:hypothetical protein